MNCCCQQLAWRWTWAIYLTAEALIFLLMISIFVLFSQSRAHLQTINFLEELISHILGLKDEVSAPTEPCDDSNSSSWGSGTATDRIMGSFLPNILSFEMFKGTMTSVWQWDTKNLWEIDPMTPSPHSDQLIRSALPLTASSEEPMSLLHRYTAFLQKRNLLVDLPHNSARNPTAGRKELLHCGQDATSSGSKFKAAKCGVQRKTLDGGSKRRHTSAVWLTVTAPAAVVSERCWGLFTAALWWHQRLPSDPSGCRYCSAPSPKMLHKADVRGRKTGSKCWNHTDRDCIVIPPLP